MGGGDDGWWSGARPQRGFVGARIGGDSRVVLELVEIEGPHPLSLGRLLLVDDGAAAVRLGDEPTQDALRDEAAWQLSNHKYWSSYALCKPLPLVELPPLPRDGRTLDQVLAIGVDPIIRSPLPPAAFGPQPKRSRPDPSELPVSEITTALQALDEHDPEDVAFALRALSHHRGSLQELSLARVIAETPAVRTPELGAACARALFAAGHHRGALKLLDGLTDPDARLLAGEIAAAQHRLDDAAREVGVALSKSLDVLGGQERMKRWRAGVYGDRAPAALGRAICIRWRGVSWRIIHAIEPIVGRAEAEIVVPAPLVSRRHLRLRSEDGGLVVEDLGSQHGTFLASARMTGPVRVQDRATLSLAGAIALVVRRASSAEGEPRAFVVEIGETRWLLAMAHDARLGDWHFVRQGSRLVVHRAGGFRFAAESTLWTEAQVGPDDVLSTEEGEVVAIEGETFVAR